MKTIICKKCGAAIDPALGECPNCGAVYYILPNEESQPAENMGGPERNTPDYGRERQGYYREAPPMGAGDPSCGPASGIPSEGPDYGASRENRNYGRGSEPYREGAGYVYEQGYGRENPAYGYDPRYGAEDNYPPPHRSGRDSLGPEMSSAPKDDLFETGKWHTFEDPDETRAFAPPPRRESAPPPQWQPPGPQRQARMYRQQRQEGDYEYSSGNRGRYACEDEEPPGGRGRGDRGPDTLKKRFIMAGIFLVAMLTVIITIASGGFNFGKNSQEKMPYVVGMNVDRATEHLEGLGLKVETQKEHSDRPENEVIAQSIRDGRAIKKNDSVTLTISSGPDEDDKDDIEYVRAPNIVGMSYDRALLELTNSGLLIARGEDRYSDRPTGEVLSQSPAKETELRKGDMVTVVLSKGPEPSPSPSPSPTPTGWKITVTYGSGGSVSPKGVITIEDGKDAGFTISANSGYEIGEVKVDGVSVGQVSSYTFTRVSSDHTIYVVFRQKSAETPTSAPTPTLPPPPEETQTVTESN